jgi:hypothetical protein
MNYYNIQFYPDNKYNNNNQRIIYNKKIKIYGSRILKKNIIPFSFKNKTPKTHFIFK